MQGLSIKKFSAPDVLRAFEKGKFELVEIGGMTLGRATYEPGWIWSEHVGKALGKKSCDVSHVGLVVSGRAMVKMDQAAITSFYGDMNRSGRSTIAG